MEFHGAFCHVQIDDCDVVLQVSSYCFFTSQWLGFKFDGDVLRIVPGKSPNIKKDTIWENMFGTFFSKHLQQIQDFKCRKYTPQN